jgi:hypothetical protein
MQCYHGVVSLTHQLEGRFKTDGRNYNFDFGKGYIEKDWGSSMPSSWIWMQSNSFGEGNTSFMLSVANIPWIGKSFTGFLGFFYHDSTIYRFATYTHAKLQILKSGTDTLVIQIRSRKNTYDIEAICKDAGLLLAPSKGTMDRRIPESNNGRIKLVVHDKKGKLIVSDSTTIAGIEFVNYMELVEGLSKKKGKDK